MDTFSHCELCASSIIYRKTATISVTIFSTAAVISVSSSFYAQGTSLTDNMTCDDIRVVYFSLSCFPRSNFLHFSPPSFQYEICTVFPIYSSQLCLLKISIIIAMHFFIIVEIQCLHFCFLKHCVLYTPAHNMHLA